MSKVTCFIDIQSVSLLIVNALSVVAPFQELGPMLRTIYGQNLRRIVGYCESLVMNFVKNVHFNEIFFLLYSHNYFFSNLMVVTSIQV
jgi:hypothetical protein